LAPNDRRDFAGQANHSIGKLVSVVIPCYNGARFLPEAIESCLRQTYRSVEVIVVDDASPDDCAAIAERFARQDRRVKVIRHPKNTGVSRAFNTGFHAARGSYFTRLAQDDIFREDAIEALLLHLERNPEAGLAYADGQSIDENGAIRKGPDILPDPSRVLAWRNMVGLCVMWRREVWERIGGFNPDFDSAEDHEYWLRVSRCFPLSKCPGGPYFFGRYHDNQGSILFAEKQEKANLTLVRDLMPADSLNRRLLRWRALSYIAYTTATVRTQTGNQAQALERILRSLVLWPLPYPAYGLTRPWIRLKTLIVILMRLVHLKADPARSASTESRERSHQSS
jgi:glycosyltransferase involved in cell wall biosynthesis